MRRFQWALHPVGTRMTVHHMATLPAILLLLSGVMHADPPRPGDPSPKIELRPGERYFRVDGRPMFVLGRNPAGTSPEAFEDHFRHTAAAGERMVRIHFTYSPPSEKAGEIDAGMLKAWDAILDRAEKHRMVVLPVLGVWADWNDGSNKETWHAWDKNAFNAQRGGPARLPSELFDDTPCRKLWLGRLETIVKHWSPRKNIVGWEIFSELDLVTGATEQRAVAFVEKAAAVIRAADPSKRPITASQAGVNQWPSLLKSPAMDFIQVHPYADGPNKGRLDDLIVSSVRQRLRNYGKPVLIGECGLSAMPPRGTLDVAAWAQVGIRHAIWASVVSGAMNGRALWWQDGYDQFEKADLCRHYHRAAEVAAAFVAEVDFTGFVPVDCTPSQGLRGAMIGNDTVRLGWFRDARCEPPEWPTKATVGQSITMDVPGETWEVEMIDPMTGKTIEVRRLAVQGGQLRIDLPEFEGSIALRVKRQDKSSR